MLPLEPPELHHLTLLSDLCVCHTSQAVVYQDDCRVIRSDRCVCLCEEYLCAVTNKGSGFIDGDLV